MTLTKLRRAVPPPRPFYFRARPPRAGGCSEPLTYGSNILRDPGFELHIGNTGGGPSGVQIPGSNVSGFTCPNMVLWSDSSCAPSNTGWQCADSGASGSGLWFISTANPRSGTYHARHNLGGAGAGELLRVYGFPDCRKLADRGTSARVESGTTVNFSFWASVSATGGSPTIKIRVWFFDEDYIDQDFPVDSGSLSVSTSYAQKTFSTVAPAWAYYMWAEIDPVAGGSTAFLDVDDATLSLT